MCPQYKTLVMSGPKAEKLCIQILTPSRLCFSEINRVRKDMYSDTVNGLVDRPPLELPEPVGAIVHLQEKLFVPVKEYPDVSANSSRPSCLIIVISAFWTPPLLQNTPLLHQLSQILEWCKPLRDVCVQGALCVHPHSFPLLKDNWGLDVGQFIIPDDGSVLEGHGPVLTGSACVHVCVHSINSPVLCASVGLWPPSQSATFLMVICGQPRGRLCHVLSSSISLHNPAVWSEEMNEGRARQDKRPVERAKV